MASGGSAVMEFFQRFQALQMHRDSYSKLIEVRCLGDNVEEVGGE